MAADPDVTAPDVDTRTDGLRGTRSRTLDVVAVWALAAAAAVTVAAVLVALAVFGGGSLPQRNGPPVEEVAVERTVLLPGDIGLTVRNTGPDPVQIAQVFVNDTFVDVDGGTDPITRLETATVRLGYPWQDDQPYLISLITSTGVVSEHEIPAAVATPGPGDVLGLMVLLGIYVGIIIPVTLGMLVLPLCAVSVPASSGCCSR